MLSGCVSGAGSSNGDGGADMFKAGNAQLSAGVMVKAYIGLQHKTQVMLHWPCGNQ